MAARRLELQRLFSAFPNGAAGLGLLLLRVAAGCALLGEGLLSASSAGAVSWRSSADVLAMVVGCALVTGTLTPAAGAVAAALSLARPFVAGPAGTPGLLNGASLALLAVMGVTVALLGPGAHSVDARLFGRREIVVPRARRGSGALGSGSIE
jgi:hypothetical protein